MAVTCVRWMNDSHAVSGSLDKTVRIWDTTSSECQRIFKGHNGTINDLKVVAQKNYIITGSSDGSVRYWDLKTGTSFRISQFSDPVANIALDGSGQFAWITTKSGAGLIETCNVFRYQAPYLFSLPESASEIDELHRVHRQKLSAAISAFNKKNYIGAMERVTQARSIKGYERDYPAFQRWADLYKVLPKLKLKDVWKHADLIEHKDRITSLAVSPVSETFFSAAKDQSIIQWDIETRRVTTILSEFNKPISALMVTSDGNRILAAYGENIQLLDIQGGQKLSLFCHHAGNVTALAITADGRFALSADDKGALYLWRLLTGEMMAAFDNKETANKKNIISTIAVTPDGRFAVTGNLNDYLVSVWDMETGKIVRVLDGHENVVTSIAVTSDGRHILSGSADGTLRLWQVQSSRKKSVRVMRGHTKRINQVAIDFQSKLAISASEDRSVRLWDVISGECLHVLEEVNCGFTTAVLSFDGHYAFAGNSDGTIMVWCLDWLLEKNASEEWDDGADIYIRNHFTTRTVTEPHKELQTITQILKFAGYGWLKKDNIGLKLIEFSQSFQNKILPGSKLSRSAMVEKQASRRKKNLLYGILTSIVVVVTLTLIFKSKPLTDNNALQEKNNKVENIKITDEAEQLTVDKLLKIAALLAKLNNKIINHNGQVNTRSLKVPVNINELSRVLKLQKTDLLDAWGQAFRYKGYIHGTFQGRIILRSAGLDKKYKTDDDLLLNGYPYWNSLEVRKNNQRVVKLSSLGNIIVQSQQEELLAEYDDETEEINQENEVLSLNFQENDIQESDRQEPDTQEVDEQQTFYDEEQDNESQDNQVIDGLEVKLRQEIFVESLLIK